MFKHPVFGNNFMKSFVDDFDLFQITDIKQEEIQCAECSALFSEYSTFSKHLDVYKRCPASCENKNQTEMEVILSKY